MDRMSAEEVSSERIPILGHRRAECRPNSIPARYVMAILGFFGFCNVYAMRVNLSVALVAMVGTAAQTNSHSETACPGLVPVPTNHTTQVQEPSFNWDSEMQSQILGSFFYGYIVTQIPGGVLAERFGAKWLFGIGVLVTSVFTILTPLAARIGVVALLVVRVVEGFAEGVTFPAINAMFGIWVPKMERSRISTLVFMGSPVGTVVSMALSGYLASSDFLGGWPSIFYVFGTLGCIWFFFWIFLIHDNPEDHPRISESELRYIQENQAGRTHAKTPWLAILTSPKVWALSITHFGQNWGYYTMLTELPTYLSNILHYNIKQNGLLSSLPYIMQAVFAVIASITADKMRQKSRFTITTIRKLINSVAFYGPAVCILLVAFVGCRPTIIMTLLCISLGLNGFIYSGFNVTHVDMSPEFSGTLMGITNCISNTSGFLAPIAVGQIIKSGQTLHNWGLVFGITSAVYFFTGTIYNLFCSAELQPWGTSEQSGTIKPSIVDSDGERMSISPITISLASKDR